MYVYFACMYVYVPGPEEARRGCWIPEFKLMNAVPGIKPWSSANTNILNH